MSAVVVTSGKTLVSFASVSPSQSSRSFSALLGPPLNPEIDLETGLLGEYPNSGSVFRGRRGLESLFGLRQSRRASHPPTLNVVLHKSRRLACSWCPMFLQHCSGCRGLGAVCAVRLKLVPSRELAFRVRKMATNIGQVKGPPQLQSSVLLVCIYDSYLPRDSTCQQS